MLLRPGPLRPRTLLLTAGALCATLWFGGCGAKTGLLVPDAGPEMDAGTDAGVDAGFDAGMCLPTPIGLQRRGAQVMFLIDRSNSMDDTIDGEDRMDGDPRPSRWDVLRTVLSSVLDEDDPLLEVGAKFFPAVPPEMVISPDDVCSVASGVELPPGTGRVRQLLRFFVTTGPGGGTPTAEGLTEVRNYYERTPAPFVPRFVVLATDGGPNCNPDTGVSRFECVCTGQPENCTMGEEFGDYNCLDADNTIEAVRALFAGLGVPVFVIGMDDPNRPDLADVLDRMAIEGGRPRDGAGRRFYSVRRREDLDGALSAITQSIAQCVFTVEPTPAAGDDVELRVNGTVLPRDEGRQDGWDYSARGRSEVTLFGPTCERVGPADEVEAFILCPRP